MYQTSQFDLIWARVTRVLSFLGGISIMVYETVWDKADRPWLYAAALGMMGLPVARAAENVLSRLSGAGSIQALPEDKTVGREKIS